MQPWKVFLATLPIFGAGVATGFFLSGRPTLPDNKLTVEPRKADQTIQIFRPSIAKLSHDLGLSTDQEDKIRSMYAASKERVRDHVLKASQNAQSDLKKQIQTEQLTLNEEIKETLNENQYNKYTNLPGMSFSRSPENPIPPDPLENQNATTPAPKTSQPAVPIETNATSSPSD